MCKQVTHLGKSQSVCEAHVYFDVYLLIRIYYFVKYLVINKVFDNIVNFDN